MSQPAAAPHGVVVPRRPAPHPAVETAFLKPEAVLYDGRSAAVIHLNASAAAVWMLLDGTLGLDKLVHELSAIFAVEVDAIFEDVESALAGFAAEGLLVERPSSA